MRCLLLVACTSSCFLLMSSPLLVFADSPAEAADVDLASIPEQLRPCYQVGPHGTCKWGLPPGLTTYYETHCPAGYCCVESQGNSCEKTCEAERDRASPYSFGKCTCANYGGHCPDNSTCIDTPNGPYCKCHGKYLGFGKCDDGLIPQRTSLRTRLKCQTEDCRPGSCDVKGGMIICDCVGGYISKQLDEEREICVLPPQLEP